MHACRGLCRTAAMSKTSRRTLKARATCGLVFDTAALRFTALRFNQLFGLVQNIQILLFGNCEKDLSFLSGKSLSIEYRAFSIFHLQGGPVAAAPRHALPHIQ